jgi:hypothetical protein
MMLTSAPSLFAMNDQRAGIVRATYTFGQAPNAHIWPL